MIETREYPVPLTDAELLTAADIVGIISAKIREREDAFAAARKEYQENIKKLKLCMAEQMEKLTTKREVREATLRIEFNKPEEGKKQIFDFTTGELYETADMTDDDWNNLFITAQEPPAVVLKAVERQPVPDPEEQDRRAGIPAFKGDTMSAALTENETGKPAEVCSVCKECHCVLHINYDKPICGVCLDRKNLKNLKEIDALKIKNRDYPTRNRFRAMFGYGCTPQKRDTTCIRFMLPSGSWGNPVYLAGDYEFAGSQAHSFVEDLKGKGWREE